MCRYGVPRAIFNGSIFLVSWAIFFGKRTDYVYVVAEALFCCPVSFIFHVSHYGGNAFSAGVVFSQVYYDVNVDWKRLVFLLSCTSFLTDGMMSVLHVDMKSPYVRPLISISFFGDGILCFTTIVIPIKLPACRELRHECPFWFCPFSRGNMRIFGWLHFWGDLRILHVSRSEMRLCAQHWNRFFSFFFFSRTTLSDCG